MWRRLYLPLRESLSSVKPSCNLASLDVLKLTTRHHNSLLPPSASAWIRKTLANSLRSRSPYAVNLLLGGYDTTTSIPHLYWIDYLGTKAVVDYAAHGAGMYVALSCMDKWWFEGMDEKAGMGLLQRCIDEVQNRESIHICL